VKGMHARSHRPSTICSSDLLHPGRHAAVNDAASCLEVPSWLGGTWQILRTGSRRCRGARMRAAYAAAHRSPVLSNYTDDARTAWPDSVRATIADEPIYSAAMSSLLQPLHLLLMMFAGWVNRALMSFDTRPPRTCFGRASTSTRSAGGSGISRSTPRTSTPRPIWRQRLARLMPVPSRVTRDPEIRGASSRN
jgi:hypothetical protein